MMAPPVTRHQRVSGELFFYLKSYLTGKPCEVFAAPFGVRLFPEKDHSDDTVVEPDILVVCDPSKIDERGCNGAPDLIIEILSPSTICKDRIFKFNKYLEAGVREYWIVDPDAKMVQVFILEKDRYITTGYRVFNADDPESKLMSDMAPVTVLPGCTIDLKTVFAGY
jgi:Uma2 family endonuclease